MFCQFYDLRIFLKEKKNKYAKRTVEFYPKLPEFAGVRYPDLFSVLHFLVRRQKRPCFLVPSNLMGELKRSFCIVDNIQLIK